MWGLTGQLEKSHVACLLLFSEVIGVVETAGKDEDLYVKTCFHEI